MLKAEDAVLEFHEEDITSVEEEKLHRVTCPSFGYVCHYGLHKVIKA